MFTAGAIKLEKPVRFGLADVDLTRYLSGPLLESRPPKYANDLLKRLLIMRSHF